MGIANYTKKIRERIFCYQLLKFHECYLMTVSYTFVAFFLR